MQEMILKVASRDAAFLDFYGALALELGDSGTVYTPYPKIRPHARMAVPAPTDVLVVLSGPEALAGLHAVARRYLDGDASRSLSLEANGRRVRLSAAAPLDAELLSEQLALGAAGEERP